MFRSNETISAAQAAILGSAATPSGDLDAEAARLPAAPLPGRVTPRNLAASTLGSAAMRFVMDDTGSLVSGGGTSGTLTDDNSDLAVAGPQARSVYGATGAGITVGILSDSFNLKGGYAADVADGNLPAGVQVLEEGTSGDDEGRAMADLVHKIAPGAQIMFHTAANSEADFADGILALAAAGCKVIVDDVAYLDEPFFQDGSILQKAAEQVVADGVSYFTSASNEGRNFYQSNFNSLKVELPDLPGNWRVANFGTAVAPLPYLNLTIPTNGTVAIDLQWDQPFADIGAGRGSADSLALALYTSGGILVGTAGSLTVGQNPEQLLQFTNTTGATGFRLVVVSNGLAAAPDLFKLIDYGSATIDDANAGQGSGTVTGHELAAGVNTVGAMDYAATPAFGGSDTIESYSAVGPGTLLFDAQGNRLATPIDADKVNFVAPDGSVTSVFAPFYGTSAAAPNAAAVAALMLQENPDLTPGQVTQMLDDSATTGLGPVGGTGAGLIQAPGAVALAMAAIGHQAVG